MVALRLLVLVAMAGRADADPKPPEPAPPPAAGPPNDRMVAPAQPFPDARPYPAGMVITPPKARDPIEIFVEKGWRLSPSIEALGVQLDTGLEHGLAWLWTWFVPLHA